MVYSVLLVAEKPSIALSLAKALSGGNYNTTKGATEVHSWSGELYGSSAYYKATGVRGHVFERDFPSDMTWGKCDPQELYTTDTISKPSQKSIVGHLARQAKGIDFLHLWLDCDREGENICFEVIRVVRKEMKNKSDDAIFRAKFSAITEPEIRKAHDNMLKKKLRPNKNEALAVDARQILDLKMGVSFTRFQTKHFQETFGDMNAQLISFGPCQTPTLGFVVERHDEITQFVAQPYWIIQISLKHSNVEVPLSWIRGRVFSKEACVMFFKSIANETNALCVSLKQTEKKKPRPLPLDTVQMCCLASKILKMSPMEAMRHAEHLYLNGYISYPRTETKSYPAGFPLRETVKQHCSHAIWGEHASALMRGDFTKPRKGGDAGDHPPITPVRMAQAGSLHGQEARMYDLVARNFLASVSPDCEYLETRATFKVGEDELFTGGGNRILNEGYMAVQTWGRMDDEYFPDIKNGELVPIAKCEMKSKQTSPSGYLTESELIKLMEHHGIGTDASIPTHIESICAEKRNFCNVSSGRTLVPTQLGVTLIHGYHKIDPEIVLPELRAFMERNMVKIVDGKEKYKDVLDTLTMIFLAKYVYFYNKIEKMNTMFSVHFSSIADSKGISSSRCVKCLAYMKLLPLKPPRLHCPRCDDTYRLPERGQVKEYMGKRCPICDFEIMKVQFGDDVKLAYTFCPNCYNNPPDMLAIENADVAAKGMACTTCLHTTCVYGYNRNYVAPCDNCATGTMLLDFTSKPKWRLVCNNSQVCRTVIYLCEKAKSVSVLKDTECETCGARLIDVEFPKNHNPMKNGETHRSGCVYCDPILKSTTSMLKAHAKRRRGGGRGRNRRGRGRGKRDSSEAVFGW